MRKKDNPRQNREAVVEALLRLAAITDERAYNDAQYHYALSCLNQLNHHYPKIWRLLPLLLAKAKKLALFNQLQPESQRILYEGTQQGVVTELAKQKQLSQLLTALNDDGIPVILLKAVAHNGRLYPQPTPRLSNDIDLLVKPKDWQRATAIIKELMQYQPKAKDVFDELYEISFAPTGAVGAALDLHKRLTYPLLFKEPEALIWQQSVPHPQYQSEKIRLLSPELTLIHQALHAHKDMCFGGYGLLDGYECITQLKPDPPLLFASAKQMGAVRPLYFWLREINRVFDMQFGVNELQRQQPGKVRGALICKVMGERASVYTDETETNKSRHYRIKQLLFQFLFVANSLRALRLQGLYLLKLAQRTLSL